MGAVNNKYKRALQVAGGLALLEIAVALLCALLPGLRQLGIQPRTVSGLTGVVFSPLLHANLHHLAANFLSLFVLVFVLFTDAKYQPKLALPAVWLVSGFGTWLIGRGDSVHIGASSVIYGLVAYLVVAGFRVGTWRGALVAIAVFLLYGGLAHGVLPQPGPISWEGHLCGALAGIWAAVRLHK